MILPLPMGPLKKKCKVIATDISTTLAGLYIIDTKKWGIYDDGTHPAETEKGINDAIVWAKDTGYAGVYLKAGTYLIEPTYYQNGDSTKGASPGVDKFAASLRGIKLVSHFIFEMNPDTIIQVNTNNAHMHTAILVYLVDNATISGGQVIGDKDSHIWTYYTGYGMGGHGYGLYIQQSNNIKVFGTKFTKHHGDGIIIYDKIDLDYMSSNIYMKNVVCDDNCRQGMSIIGGDNMLFENCVFSGSNGQAPECGAVIESGSYASTGIIFKRCKFTKNNRHGLLNYDGNVKLEDCIFTQEFGINAGAADVEVINTTFNAQDQDDYYAKYPYVMVVDTAYKVGDRARIDFTTTSEGYTCIKAGTTSGSMYRQNNYPPSQIQSSILGIKYTYGDTEWVHTDNFFSYSACGMSGTTENQVMPVNLRANNASYVVGDQVRLANGTALVCTVQGTSGTSDPSTRGKYVDDILIDGTNGLTWKIVDNVYPKGYRKNLTAYYKGDIVWWEDGVTVWECVASGTTASTPPTLKDLPLDAILIAHASSSRIKKVAFDPAAPDWQPKILKNYLDKANIAGTTWQYVEKRNYKLTFGYYSAGDKEPDTTCIPRGDTLIDGTVVWKKVSDKITKLTVEGCTFINTPLNAGAGTVVAKNNKVVNGNYILSGFDITSSNNTILNKGIPTNRVMFNLNSGQISDEVIKNSKVTVNVLHDSKYPSKKLVEKLSLEDSTFFSETVLFNSSIIISRNFKSAYTTMSNCDHIRITGGRISAYLNPSVILFDAWTRYFDLQDALIELVLSPGAGFLQVHSRSSDGWFPNIENCIFRVTPLNNSTLISVGYGDANIKLISNKFYNLDYSKSISVLPPGDIVNTSIRNNFFDFNYYVTDINSSNNTGGYGIRTTIESSGLPVRGTYALGTRVLNIAPAIGSPKSWLVTTAGAAYSAIRANDTAYTAGTFVKWPKGSNIYECIVAGTTASAPPSAGAETVADGTVTWLYRGNTTALFTSEGYL